MPISPDAEVRGDVVLAMINVMGAFKTLAVTTLAEHGIVDPEPHQWYPLRSWLDSFDTIAKKVGPNTVYQIGKKIPEEGFYPPGVDSIEVVLEQVDSEFQSCHRGQDVGQYEFVFTGMRSGKMTCRNPYPCDFDRGLIEALARRFEPEDSLSDVRHDSTAPCRKTGGDSCTLLISW